MSRITRIDIDDSAIAPATPEMEQERRVAIFDLICLPYFLLLFW